MIASIIALVTITAAQAGAPVAFRTVAHGADSKVEARHELIARTGGSWHLIWYKHHGSYDPPAIDSRREMILAVFAGRRPASTLEIVSVNREGRTLVVRYRVQVEPVPGATATYATPFHIIAVASDPAPIRFVDVSNSR
jgi:hypothetical protein